DETMYEEQLKRNFNRQQRIFIIAGQMLDRTTAVAEYLRKVGLDIVCVEARTSEDKGFLALWPTIAPPPPPPGGIRKQAEELGLTELLEFLEEELTKERHLVKREERQWSIAFEISSVRRVLVTLYVRSPEVAVQPYFLKDTLAMVTDRDKLLNTLAEKLGPGAAAVTPGGDLKVFLRASDEGEKFLQVLRDDVFPSLESVSSA
ncbi:unnamed protein product, partial [marine sediment metagenome]